MENSTKELERLVIIQVAEILNCNPEKLSMESAIDITEGWDSLKNMDVILSLESKFNIVFQPEELMRLDSILEMTKSISLKISK